MMLDDMMQIASDTGLLQGLLSADRWWLPRGSCLVVIAPCWLLASSCRGVKKPPINVLIERARLVVVRTVFFLRYLERTGLHGMGVTHDLFSSCFTMVCSNHKTKLGGILTTHVR